MSETIRSLYISQTGMSEALGQSQVLAYLTGLARRGVDIEVLSYEPAGTPEDAIAAVRKQMQDAGIAWRPLVRSKSHAIARKVYESGLGAAHALALALKRRPHIVHARSHVATAVADVVATIAPGAKLLFDCRGMLGDEYVDAGYWTKDRLEYRMVKAFERRAFRRAEGIVVLTSALRRWLDAERMLPEATPVAVIPCCVDVDKFRPDEAARAARRKELGLTDDRLLGVYSGSLGGWYLEDEMARVMARVKALRPDAALLVLTRFPTATFLAAAKREGLSERDLIVRSAKPSEVPGWLSAADFGISFIRSCFSKMGSSPTKVAEYLACGLPVLVNGNIGDQAELAEEPASAVVLDSFDATELERGARAITQLAARAGMDRPSRVASARSVAERRFSVNSIGVPRYEKLYKALCGSQPERIKAFDRTRA